MPGQADRYRVPGPAVIGLSASAVVCRLSMDSDVTDATEDFLRPIAAAATMATAANIGRRFDGDCRASVT